jgi:hypothetical protein
VPCSSALIEDFRQSFPFSSQLIESVERLRSTPKIALQSSKKILECIDKHQEAVSLFNAGPPHVSKNAAIVKPSDAFAMEILGRKKPKLDP